MPPPVSPTRPFGAVPDSVDVGCAAMLLAGSSHSALCVRDVGVVDGVDVGLGLFATDVIMTGTWLCEYTGVVEMDRGPGDCFAHSLPCMEELVVSAREFGNVARLINHSDTDFNVEFACVAHEGVLHLVCRTLRDVGTDQQLLANYGVNFWRSRGRPAVVLAM
eukprot:TRINITY_DN35124_c0_g2_i1.p1 TRINITY_DN35124_c0_g2~~TRINITY_DN35124_c0_g2_i1.p1  ORF type:complete len:163 (+),score=34.91 TRINITY_DN35124_c0_g2_i1:187-675(+)